MNHAPASLAYRRVALQQASTVGLVIALYDTLAGNLARAAAALESNDIETRCKELSHGFRVLQQLDGMLDMQNGGEAAKNIRRFYTHLRGQMLAAQFKRSPAILHEQMRIVLEVREAWHQLDTHTAPPPQLDSNPGRSAHVPSAATSVTQDYDPALSQRSSFSCSA